MNTKMNNLINFLIGTQRILIFVRSDIAKPINAIILKVILKFISSYLLLNTVDFESFKSEIISIHDLDKDVLEFLLNALSTNNINIKTDNFIEINKYMYVMKDSIIEICTHIDQGNTDRAYDLVDAIHCLPEALLNKKQWNSKRYWETYINTYRRKWDETFLRDKEKELVKSGFWSFLSK